MRSAAAFQLVMMPSTVRPTIASNDDPTMASLSSSAASRSFWSVMSRTYTVWSGSPGTSTSAMLSSRGNSQPSARTPTASMRLTWSAAALVAR